MQVPVKRRTDNYKLGEFSSRSPISRKAAQQIEPVSDICIVASFYYCRIFYFSTNLFFSKNNTNNTEGKQTTKKAETPDRNLGVWGYGGKWLLVVVMFLGFNHKHCNAVVIDVVDDAVMGSV